MKTPIYYCDFSHVLIFVCDFNGLCKVGQELVCELVCWVAVVRFFWDVSGCGISTCDKRLQIWPVDCTIMG
jgi:hypothetical protein